MTTGWCVLADGKREIWRTVDQQASENPSAEACTQVCAG